MTVETNLIFEKRDFLYDNGLVNVFLTLQKDSRFDKVSENTVRYQHTDIALNDLKMEISGKSYEIEEIYFILRSHIIPMFLKKLIITSHTTILKRIKWLLDLF